MNNDTPDLDADIERCVARFGEEYRPLIVDALYWARKCEQTVPGWRPLNSKQFIHELLKMRAKK